MLTSLPHMCCHPFVSQISVVLLCFARCRCHLIHFPCGSWPRSMRSLLGGLCARVKKAWGLRADWQDHCGWGSWPHWDLWLRNTEISLGNRSSSPVSVFIILGKPLNLFQVPVSSMKCLELQPFFFFNSPELSTGGVCRIDGLFFPIWPSQPVRVYVLYPLVFLICSTAEFPKLCSLPSQLVGAYRNGNTEKSWKIKGNRRDTYFFSPVFTYF